jgi:hypothetical protein
MQFPNHPHQPLTRRASSDRSNPRVTLDPATYRAVQSLAAILNLPQTQLIRLALDAALRDPIRCALVPASMFTDPRIQSCTFAYNQDRKFP